MNRRMTDHRPERPGALIWTFACLAVLFVLLLAGCAERPRIAQPYYSAEHGYYVGRYRPQWNMRCQTCRHHYGGRRSGKKGYRK